MSSSPPVVIDTSVILKWFSQHDEKHCEQAEILLQRGCNEEVSLCTPDISRYEVGNVLIVGKKFSIGDALEAINFFNNTAPISQYALTSDLAELSCFYASEFGVTYYDAAFAALAKSIGAPLVTDDFRHHSKIKEIEVIKLSDYK